MISIVIVTCDRIGLFEQTLEKVIARVSDLTREIVVWDNGSTDGTRELIESLDDPRLIKVLSPTNVGLNAYRPAFEKCTQPYLIELDDDILDAPEEWDRLLLEAYQKVEPHGIGYLAADVIDDGKSRAADIRYRRDAHKYEAGEVAGVPLIFGPSGGWCTIVSREVDEAAGGHKQNPDFIYFCQDTLYTAAVRKAGYKLAMLADVKVFHASGPAYSDNAKIHEHKEAFYTWFRRRNARRKKIKQTLEKLPLIPAINRRFALYTPPPR